MRKFILKVTDDIQEMIEAKNVAEAKKRYAEIRAESGETVSGASTQVSVASIPQRKGLYEHLLDLKTEGFFANPQPLGNIKAKLQEKTLHYPTTTFPPYLNRLIRERILRRFKQNTEGKELGLRQSLSMDLSKQLTDHEERIVELERKLSSLLNVPLSVAPRSFTFIDKNKGHTELLEELLKSEYCHSKNGLTFDEIIQLFLTNKRPVVPKKIRDVLAIWKKRGKIEAVKNDDRLSYFWIENGN